MPRPKEAASTTVAVFETRSFPPAAGAGRGGSTAGGWGADPSLLRDSVHQSTASIPPPATSQRFVVHDLGNCSPRFMRSTMYQVPATVDVLRTTELPLAVVCQPLARGDPEDTHAGRVPVVDASQHGPVRCERCKAYINPFVRWLDAGRRFQCNMCGHLNETPTWYFCNVGPNGMRRDQFERPELAYGSVEFVASQEYSIREAAPLACIFVIDASQAALNAGITQRVCEAMTLAIDSGEVKPARVGVALFSDVIQYVTMRPGSHQPHVVVVPDVDDPYAPLSESLLLDSKANLGDILGVLDFIKTHCATLAASGSGVQSSCSTSAIHSAGKVLKRHGGRVIAFVASTPTVGKGVAAAGSAQAKTAATNATLEKVVGAKGETYTLIGEDLSESQVCVDVFAFKYENGAAGCVDTACLHILRQTTGGSFSMYEDFDGRDPASTDAKRLCQDLKHNLTREQGYEALLRVRVSNGLDLDEYKGSFYLRTATDIDLAGVDSDKSVVAYFKHSGKLAESSEVCFQCALLYTTSDGERRIRVHTLSLPVTSVLGNVFRSADLESTMHALLRPIVSKYPKLLPAQVKEEATGACVSILYCYRRYCATSSSSGQLILPEALKLMPLYMLSFYKFPALQTKSDLNERADFIAALSSIPIEDLIPVLFPRVIPLHAVENAGDPLPNLLSCSSESMDDDVVLLMMENNSDGFVWIGNAVYPTVLERLFGATSFETIKAKLTQSTNSKSCLAASVASRMCSGRSIRLRFVPRGSMSETRFLAKCVEDRTSSGMSYVEYLCHLHRLIQNKFL